MNKKGKMKKNNESLACSQIMLFNEGSLIFACVACSFLTCSLQKYGLLGKMTPHRVMRLHVNITIRPKTT